MAKKAKSTLLNMVLSLTVIAVVAAAALAAVNNATKDTIEQKQKEKTEKAIREVLPEFAELQESKVLPDGEKDTLVCNKALDAEGNFVGMAVKSFTDKGFNGHIDVMVGFDAEGNVFGYQILKTGETPSLGSKAQDWFQKDGKGSIIGKTPGDNGFTVSKDGGEVDAITAATISSRAFCDAVNRAYKAFQKGGIE